MFMTGIFNCIQSPNINLSSVVTKMVIMMIPLTGQVRVLENLLVAPLLTGARGWMDLDLVVVG